MDDGGCEGGGEVEEGWEEGGERIHKGGRRKGEEKRSHLLGSCRKWKKKTMKLPVTSSAPVKTIIMRPKGMPKPPIMNRF